MGIPSYFSYIVKNHIKIIKKYEKNVLKIDNLYLDCNSIIYDAYSKMTFEKLDETIGKSIIRQVIAKIEYYIETISPLKTVIIAFDGVAPVAKLEQQRQRRYKSAYQNEISKQIFKKTTSDAWNTAAITPGTIFMSELNSMVKEHFSAEHFSKFTTTKVTTTKVTTAKFTTTNESKDPLLNIIVSGSNEAGEGEHKLFDYIRKHKEKHASETTVIYGLDADLIMLSINHLPLSPMIYLFRETPHFIQSIDSSLEPDANYFLDIPELTSEIIKHLNNDQSLDSLKAYNKVYDYIFICFFLGNDFLPHFPALNIRTGGIDKMLNAYRATIKSDENLTDGKTINWANVRKLISYLAKLEEVFISNEHKTRDYKERNARHIHINANKTTVADDEFKAFENSPQTERDLEKYINPFKPYWQQRYYRGLLGIKSDTTGELTKDVAINYLQGLEWTMKYYTTGCADWRWQYKYNYPPLLQDLIKYVPLFTTEFVPVKPFDPVTEITQLCYVLPKTSLHLLPKGLGQALIANFSDWYPDNCEFVWAYCRYFWESHAVMNEIDVKELEHYLKTNKHLFV